MGESRATIVSGMKAGAKDSAVITPFGYGRGSLAQAPSVRSTHCQEVLDALGGVYGILASEITPRDVEWLWNGYVPLGSLTVVAGPGGCGKTFMLLDWTARVTSGLPWPAGGTTPAVGKVLYISGEDDPEMTIVPRLTALGATLPR